MTNGAQFAGPAVAAAAISRSQSDSAGLSSFPHDLDHDVDEMIKEEDEDEDSDVDNFADFLDVLKVDADKGKSMYLGDSHWHLVLAEVGFKFLPLLSLIRGRVSVNKVVSKTSALSSSLQCAQKGIYCKWL